MAQRLRFDYSACRTLTGVNCGLAHERLGRPSCSRSSLLMAPSRSRGAESAQRSKSKKATDVHNAGKKRRMKKSEIDDLVRGIGLEPVVQSASSDTKRKRKSDRVQPQQIYDTKNDNDYEHAHFFGHKSQPEISLQTQLDYSRKGHAVLRSFLSVTLIQQLRSELLPHAASNALSAWRQKVEVQLADCSDIYFRDNAQDIVGNLKSINECQDLLESLGLDPLSGDLPFLQHFNSWRAANESNGHIPNRTVTKLCLSSYLARTASILLDAPTIRLYQDSLFHKRVGDGWTPWHSDARMAPFDTSKMVTFWIPLQKVPAPEEGGTGLLFVDGSHADFALPYWSGVGGPEYDRLEKRYDKNGNGGVSHHMPLALGDVTVHNGWTLHCADAADFDMGGDDRYAFSVTYVDGHAELREGVLSSEIEDDGSDKEDIWSFRSWVENVEPRKVFRHPQVPIVWPPDERDVE
ncbi:hypothetical protein ACHAWF_008782 [Thalassiosira exigua]